MRERTTRPSIQLRRLAPAALRGRDRDGARVRYGGTVIGAAVAPVSKGSAWSGAALVVTGCHVRGAFHDRRRSNSNAPSAAQDRRQSSRWIAAVGASRPQVAAGGTFAELELLQIKFSERRGTPDNVRGFHNQSMEMWVDRT
jgi:hypothetical protein